MNNQRTVILPKVVVARERSATIAKTTPMADRVSERSMLCAEIRESSLITQITILKSGGIGKVTMIALRLFLSAIAILFIFFILLVVLANIPDFIVFMKECVEDTIDEWKKLHGQENVGGDR